jgi:hypothetical protein
MPQPFSVRDQDDPTRDLGEWTEDGSIRLPGNLTVAGTLSVAGAPLGAGVDSVAYVFEVPAGAAARVVWRAPKDLLITAVRGLRNGGTGATVNATNAGADLAAVDLSLTTADTFLAAPSLQNTTVAAGAALGLAVRSVAGSPTYVTVAIDYQVLS